MVFGRLADGGPELEVRVFNDVVEEGLDLLYGFWFAFELTFPEDWGILGLEFVFVNVVGVLDEVDDDIGLLLLLLLPLCVVPNIIKEKWYIII